MLAILAVTFPFFALVLCGYLAVRRAILPQLAIPGLNSFVLSFARPCLLYRFGSTTPLARLLDARVFGVYLACALCMVGAIALGLALDPSALTVLVLVACLPSASNVAMLAERFGADTGRVARIILISTALSFLSFAAAVAVPGWNQIEKSSVNVK